MKIKRNTSVNQSIVLKEFLPIESTADLVLFGEPYDANSKKSINSYQVINTFFRNYDKPWKQKYKYVTYFPCWSVTSLINILSKIAASIDEDGYVEFSVDKNGCIINLVNCGCESQSGYSLIDACYSMIIKLHEQNLI